MAKDEKKKSKKAKLKAPKTIAGVKVPKDVRKAADPLLRAAEHPVVAEVATAALIAAAGALASRKIRGKGDEAMDRARDKVGETGEVLKTRLAAAAEKFADRALAALAKFEQAVEAQRPPEAPDAPEAPEAPEAPNASNAPKPPRPPRPPRPKAGA